MYSFVVTAGVPDYRISDQTSHPQAHLIYPQNQTHIGVEILFARRDVLKVFERLMTVRACAGATDS